MNKVLNDVTSFAFVSELLNDDSKPTAINIFNLSNIVESIVLHERILVLDGEERDSDRGKYIKKAVGCFPQKLVNVIENPYSRQNHAFIINDFRNELLGQVNEWKGLADYKRTLAEIYRRYVNERLESPHAVWDLFGRLRRSPMSFATDYYGCGDFSPTLTCPVPPGKVSARKDWALVSPSTYGAFEDSIFFRAALYLNIADKWKVPYKADFIRTPILGALLSQGHGVRFPTEETIFKLAAQNEDKRNSILLQFMQNESLNLMTPLIIRAILKEAKHRDDVIKLAVQMRETNAAKRFRAACGKLNDHIRNEEFEAALHEVQWALKSLSAEISAPPNEAIYTILAVPSLGVKGMAAPMASGSVAASTLVKTGKSFFKWWRGRKYSFVSKVVDQTRKAQSLNSEIHRVFGKKLDNRDISLLRKME